MLVMLAGAGTVEFALLGEVTTVPLVNHVVLFVTEALLVHP